MEAVLALIRVMAATPYQSWAGCRSFGLRDFFETSRMRSELPHEAVIAVNSTLQDLGLLNFTVESITAEFPAGQQSGSYNVTLLPADRSGLSISARL